MEFRAGWSGEMNNNTWRKIDIRLDDTDLARLARDYDFDIREAKHIECFALLEAEANVLLWSEVLLRFPTYASLPEYQTELINCRTMRDNTVTAIRKAQGLVKDDQAPSIETAG